MVVCSLCFNRRFDYLHPRKILRALTHTQLSSQLSIPVKAASDPDSKTANRNW
jgi:hypothetical protein